MQRKKNLLYKLERPLLVSSFPARPAMLSRLLLQWWLHPACSLALTPERHKIICFIDASFSLSIRAKKMPQFLLLTWWQVLVPENVGERVAINSKIRYCANLLAFFTSLFRQKMAKQISNFDIPPLTLTFGCPLMNAVSTSSALLSNLSLLRMSLPEGSRGSFSTNTTPPRSLRDLTDNKC